MEIRIEADGPVMGSPVEVMRMFVADTQSRQSEWKDRVRDDPDAFRHVEREIAGHYASVLPTSCVVVIDFSKDEL